MVRPILALDWLLFLECEGRGGFGGGKRFKDSLSLLVDLADPGSIRDRKLKELKGRMSGKGSPPFFYFPDGSTPTLTYIFKQVALMTAEGRGEYEYHWIYFPAGREKNALISHFPSRFTITQAPSSFIGGEGLPAASTIPENSQCAL